MRSLSQIEQANVSGGEVQIVVPVNPNQEFSFKGGFDSSVNMVSGFFGFAIGVPCAFVILPVKAAMYVGSGVYNGVSDYFYSKKN
jgi:hypothetical protein